MILFPAIDLKGGEAVRLKLGDMAQATVFNTDPAAQARTFESQGFQYLHVVELEAYRFAALEVDRGKQDHGVHPSIPSCRRMARPPGVSSPK